jgi:hypothetical protein
MRLIRLSEKGKLVVAGPNSLTPPALSYGLAAHRSGRYRLRCCQTIETNAAA